MRENPRPNQIYRHFKGNLYKIITLATHSETREKMVVYQALYGEFGVFIRPLSMFMEEVDRIKYPNVTQKMRFEHVEEILVPEEHIISASFRGKEQGAEQDIEHKEQEIENKKEEKECEAGKGKEEAFNQSEEEHTEEFKLDPILEEYLDAASCRERLLILEKFQDKVTNEMIATMAIVNDFDLPEGDKEERYEALKRCLMLREKYEI